MKTYFALLVFLALATILVIVATIFSDVGAWFKSPDTYLLCLGCLILSIALLCLQYFIGDTTLRCVREYCIADRSKAMPNLMLVMSLVIVYCYNVMLLCAYLYSQQQSNTEMSSTTSFIEKLTSIFTQHFWVTFVYCPCYLATGFYLFGLLASFIFDSICNFQLDERPGSLVVCTIIMWFMCSIALLLRYSLLPSGIWSWQEVGEIVFFLLRHISMSLALGSSKRLFFNHPLPRYPSWLPKFTCVTIVIAFVAVVLAQNPAIPSQISFSSTVHSCTRSQLEYVESSVATLPAGLRSSLASKDSLEQDSLCAGIDEDIQLSQLHYLQYRDCMGKIHELRIKECLFQHCKDLADKFGFDMIVQTCVINAESCCQKLFNAWRDQDTPGYSYSWNGLVKALKELGLKRLAVEIDRARRNRSLK